MTTTNEGRLTNLADFAYEFLSLQCPLSDRKMNAGFIKPFHRSTNPENLSSVSEITWLIEKTPEKHITH